MMNRKAANRRGNIDPNINTIPKIYPNKHSALYKGRKKDTAICPNAKYPGTSDPAIKK
jgi:hypothetical protein